MKYQYDQYHNSIPPSQVTSYRDEVRDTYIAHMNMEDFLIRINAEAIENMTWIKKSYIHLLSTFPLAANEPEFILACARHFDATSRTIWNREGMISKGFKRLSCEVITEKNELRNEEDILIGFTKAIRLRLEAVDFDINVLNTFASWKCSLNDLQSKIGICSKEVSEAASTLRKVTMAAQYIGEPDATIVRESLRKFGKLVDTL